MIFVAFSVFVLKFVDFLRLSFNYKENKSGILTQATAWIAGIILVILSIHANITSKIVLPGVNQIVGTLDLSSQILLGLLIGSLASVIIDFKQAFDRSDSAFKPRLGRDPDPSFDDEEEDLAMMYGENKPSDTTIYVGSKHEKSK